MADTRRESRRRSSAPRPLQQNLGAALDDELRAALLRIRAESAETIPPTPRIETRSAPRPARRMEPQQAALPEAPPSPRPITRRPQQDRPQLDLADPLRYERHTFRRLLPLLSQDERDALRTAIIRDLRRVSREATTNPALLSTVDHAQELVGILDLRVFPRATDQALEAEREKRKSSLTSTRKGRGTSRPQQTRDTAEERTEMIPRFLRRQAYSPSPSKFILPPRGRTVTGGLPSLGKRYS